MFSDYKPTKGDMFVAYGIQAGLTPQETARLALEEDRGSDA